MILTSKKKTNWISVLIGKVMPLEFYFTHNPNEVSSQTNERKKVRLYKTVLKNWKKKIVEMF